ncbi:hypothetical protein CI238_02561 [Colletotrichum incanum]|uniref:C3H1-type domain-containing protein n=1 Tax=Colletotrichum incanum TaxID=1573173 RepID=A0A167D7L2_COLIC|nr:hypothetical protein CI238_02561 [Colletotrichum incanum]
MASPDVVTPYAGSSIHPRKDKRSTCRHFREGKCVFWQTPEVCNFPHRPQHAPHRPLPVETSPAPPMDGPPPLHLEEAPPYVRAFMPVNPHPTDSLAQVPTIGPNSDDGRHARHGDDPQYLGYHLSNTAPNGRAYFQPCHRLVPSPPGFPFAEPRPVHVEYYPRHGVYYHNPPIPSQYIPGGYIMPTDVGFNNDHSQAHQNQCQQPYQLPHTPPDSAPNSPIRFSISTSFARPSSEGYIAPPFVEQEESPLVNPEKLRRERSKGCWYGEDCKRPNCYYRHGVMKDDTEGESSGSASAASSAPADDLSNASSEKGKERWNTGGEKGLENPSDQESSTKVKVAADEKSTAGDEAFEEQPSYNREHNAFRRAPLVVNGTDYRRLLRDYTHVEVF